MRCLPLVCLVLIVVLGACDTGPLLREHYTGRSLLEPELEAYAVKRDAYGNAVFDEARSETRDRR